MEINLYHGDCLQIMQEIPANSIDCIICDLPYGTTHNKWDSCIDLNTLWDNYERIIKDNGAIILFGQNRFTAKLIMSKEKLYRYTLVWNKVLTSGFLNANKRPLVSHEDILVFYKRLPTYNPQFTEGEPLHGMGNSFRKRLNANHNYSGYKSCDNPSANRKGDTKKYPKSVLTFSRRPSAKMLHPTEKPVELIEYLIRTYTNENDLILDNCMGSGTTGVACQKLNRSFIGIEKDNKYFEIAKDRIEYDRTVDASESK